ncbi:ATP-binding cassette domain-containing protein [Ahniella affigens]|nr:ATP-binding cassette domain-containing protein [Ahniella affigens]
MLAIETRTLSKTYPGGFGVQDLNLQVPEAVIFGFLGPNGAGKTTTIRLLLDLLTPDTGEVWLSGQRLSRQDRRALQRVGAMVETPSVYPHLSGRDNLRAHCLLLDLPEKRADEALLRVDLSDAAHRRVAQYSLGMRQRLGIAMALLNRPNLLILDEPSNGLDPPGVLAMRHLLRQLVQDDGITVFLSSHLLHEMQQLAQHLALLKQGRLFFQGSLTRLRSRFPNQLELRCADIEGAAQWLTDHGEYLSRPSADRILVANPKASAEQINRGLMAAGISLTWLSVHEPSLEDMFLDAMASVPNHAAAEVQS